MIRRTLIAGLAALPLVSLAPAFAQSGNQPAPANTQTARGIPGERIPSAQEIERQRLHEEHDRRLRDYLAAVARMA